MQCHLVSGKALLKQKGYTFKVEQDWSLAETTKTNYYVYAIRDSERTAYISSEQQRPSLIPQLANPILSAPELRNHLQNSLPDYMIPASFMFLETLPLTPNGKVDRRALPEPDAARPNLEDDFVAPRTPAEEIMAKLWRFILNIDRIGMKNMSGIGVGDRVAVFPEAGKMTIVLT